MAARLHSHYYEGITTYNDGHTHQYSGTTSPSPDLPGHTHGVFGTTSFDDGHVHRYNFRTLREIKTNRGHYHQYRGMAGYANAHTHMLQGTTSVS